jgi:hypothetical protein
MCGEVAEYTTEVLASMKHSFRLPHINNYPAAEAWLDSLKPGCNTSCLDYCGVEYLCASEEARADGVVHAYARFLS